MDGGIAARAASQGSEATTPRRASPGQRGNVWPAHSRGARKWVLVERHRTVRRGQEFEAGRTGAGWDGTGLVVVVVMRRRVRAKGQAAPSRAALAR